MTTERAYNTRAEWLSDGFRTSSTGDADIWYRRLSGDTSTKAVSATKFAELAPPVSPMWSRDGRKIYYWSASQFIEAILSTNPAFGVASRRMLFTADYQAGYGQAGYDVMPDGASFLMTRSVENRRDEIVVVHKLQGLAQVPGEGRESAVMP